MDESDTSLRITGIGSKRPAELAAHAKRLGMTPQRYARELIERGLKLDREAREKSFDEILAPLRSSADTAGEVELTGLVDRARTRHHASRRKGR